MSEHSNDSASRTSLLRKRLKFYITVTRVETRTLFLKQLRIIIVKISDNLYFQLKEADQQETQIFRALINGIVIKSAKILIYAFRKSQISA